jgi:hypothetical protein
LRFLGRALLTASLTLGACSQSSPEEQAEAGRLSRAVDRLRDAPNSEKPALLAALSALSCTIPALCQFRAECVSAYERHVHGIDLTEQARLRLAALGDAGDVSKLLDRAGAELESAKTGAARCTDTQGVVRRRYRF